MEYEMTLLKEDTLNGILSRQIACNHDISRISWTTINPTNAIFQIRAIMMIYLALLYISSRIDGMSYWTEYCEEIQHKIQFENGVWLNID